jgi:hypothetical protein
MFKNYKLSLMFMYSFEVIKEYYNGPVGIEHKYAEKFIIKIGEFTNIIETNHPGIHDLLLK